MLLFCILIIKDFEKKKKYHSFHKNIKQLLSNCFLGSKSAF